jgi:hypothetical protein
LLKDSFPCPIPTAEKDAHRAASSKPTLPIGRRGSTAIMRGKGSPELYAKPLLHK